MVIFVKEIEIGKNKKKYVSFQYGLNGIRLLIESKKNERINPLKESEIRDLAKVLAKTDSIISQLKKNQNFFNSIKGVKSDINEIIAIAVNKKAKISDNPNQLTLTKGYFYTITYEKRNGEWFFTTPEFSVWETKGSLGKLKILVEKYF